MRVVARGWGSCAPVRARVLAWSVLGPRWWRACVCPRGRVGVCPRCCVVARACWFGARGRVGVWVCVGGPRLCARPPRGGVLWRFPTLPHPLGCSTIGAAGLSFQVRNVAGRFPGAVTTTRLCRPSPPFVGPPCGGLGGGWVGRGSYSGCGASPGLVRWARCGLVAGGCRGVVVPPVWWLGGLVWCRPISTSRLASASRRFHLWPIDPLFWRGPLTPCGGVETSSRSGLPA